MADFFGFEDPAGGPLATPAEMADAWEGLCREYELTNGLPPTPVAVWLIDRPGWLPRIKVMMPGMAPLDTRLQYCLSVYLWTSEGIRNEFAREVGKFGRSSPGAVLTRFQRRFPFLWRPGVWIEMSRGPHIRIEEE